jgi:peptidoglycan/xylan/chitin deacetylase (PgdA/CDA1 family)
MRYGPIYTYYGRKKRGKFRVLIILLVLILYIGAIWGSYKLLINIDFFKDILAHNNEEKDSINLILMADKKKFIDESMLENIKLETPDLEAFTYIEQKIDGTKLMKDSNTSIDGEKYSVKAEEAYDSGRNEGKRYVFLTFDDGPSTSITPKVLDILKLYDVKATFFVLGNMLEGKYDIAKRYISEGHAIANHTYTHNYGILYPNGKVDTIVFKEELNKTETILKNILGSDLKIRIVRFPGGSFEIGKKLMREELSSKAMYYIDWNAENRDGVKQDVSVKEQLDSIKSNVNAAETANKNVVLLMHDSASKKTTLDALPTIIEYFKSKEYEFKILN